MEQEFDMYKVYDVTPINGYDPLKDVSEVSQTGFVDLNTCWKNNSIPSDIDIDEDSFDGVDNPASLLSNPKDVFDMALQRETIGNYKAPSNIPSGEGAASVE